MMRRISAAPLLMAVLLLAATAMAAQGPFNVHQLHSLRRLQSFDVSPSGQIVYDLRVWVRDDSQLLNFFFLLIPVLLLWSCAGTSEPHGFPWPLLPF
jgi:hypothetical protein